MRYIILGSLLLVGSLAVDGQHAPDNLDYSTTHVRMSSAQVSSDIKVINGAISDFELLRETTAIIGTVNIDGAYITFKPTVPFDQETPYTLVYNDQYFHFEIARSKDQTVMAVTDIYPSVKEVPANILKWYIKFSQPVNPVRIYEHINFLDREGIPIDRSILELGAPLLSEDGMLLTVWIEPGRQKRLLGPNRYLGSVFEPYREYTLQIAHTLKDATGVPIKQSVRHTFTTTGSDRTKPIISDWDVTMLQSDTHQTLMITCNEYLDYGSLLDAFSVWLDGDRVEGKLSYDGLTSSIHFIPADKWKKGIYTIHVAHQLEDLAGNNLHHLFDRPINEKEREVTSEELTLTLVCR